MEAKPTKAMAASVMDLETSYVIGDEEATRFYLAPTITIAWNIHDGDFDQFEIITLSKIGNGQFVESSCDTLPVGRSIKIKELDLPEFDLLETDGFDSLSQNTYDRDTITIKVIIQAVDSGRPGASTNEHSEVLMSTSAQRTFSV